MGRLYSVNSSIHTSLVVNDHMNFSHFRNLPAPNVNNNPACLSPFTSLLLCEQLVNLSQQTYWLTIFSSVIFDNYNIPVFEYGLLLQSTVKHAFQLLCYYFLCLLDPVFYFVDFKANTIFSLLMSGISSDSIFLTTKLPSKEDQFIHIVYRLSYIFFIIVISTVPISFSMLFFIIQG